jgi:hypothetical protein
MRCLSAMPKRVNLLTVVLTKSFLSLPLDFQERELARYLGQVNLLMSEVGHYQPELSE